MSCQWPGLVWSKLRLARLVAWIAWVLSVEACTYLAHVAQQSELVERQQRDPSLGNLKHLLDSETLYVYGRIVDPKGLYGRQRVAVGAFAEAFGKVELVDVMQNASVGTHYGLNLPLVAGQKYLLLALLDRGEDGHFDAGDVIGQRSLDPNQLEAKRRVVGNVDIQLSSHVEPLVFESFAVEPTPRPQPSLFYPAGSIRELKDAIFDSEIATLGVYRPAAFSEKAPTMFYTLEEELGFKIPVILVHGLGGSPRQFEPLVQRLDRSRFKPWFFYYPSGVELRQLATLFYRIYLSGDAVGRHPQVPTIIVAHSMGGLLVREALNLIEEPANEKSSIILITVASPLAGHPAAASGEEHGLLVVPSWRSLNPASDFVAELYRKRLPPFVQYGLIYSYRDDSTLRFGENSDGVVPLSSQLRPEAQAEASFQRGFDATHVGILSDERALDFLLAEIHQVRTSIPDDHMEWFQRGGFATHEAGRYGPLAQYYIEALGQYLRALAEGRIEAVDEEQRHFVEVAQGRAQPVNDVERAWLDFAQHELPTP